MIHYSTSMPFDNASSVGGSPHAGLPVIGLGGPGFDGIHLTALSVLSLSTTVSSILLCYLCCCSHRPTKKPRDCNKKRISFRRFARNKFTFPASSVLPASEANSETTTTTTSCCNSPSDQSCKLATIGELSQRETCMTSLSGSTTCESRTDVNAKETNGTEIDRKSASSGFFWDWNVGERLVVYLAICDFGMSTSHILDHAYIYHVKGHPPDVACTVMALLMQEFIFSQWVVVLFTAGSACMLVVFGKKLKLGRWDYRLLLAAFGGPLVLGIIGANFNLLGQSGAWCIFDLRYPSGQIYSQVVSIIQIVSFATVSIAYAAIWVKIWRTARRVDCSWTDRYQNAAKIMMIFVAVFIFQWWSLVMSNIWFLVETPPPWVIIITVTLVNMGGIYNLVAYTIIRRRLQLQTTEIAQIVVETEKDRQKERPPKRKTAKKLLVSTASLNSP